MAMDCICFNNTKCQRKKGKNTVKGEKKVAVFCKGENKMEMSCNAIFMQSANKEWSGLHFVFMISHLTAKVLQRILVGLLNEPFM